MNRFLAAALLTLLGAGPALAQQKADPAFVGKWQVDWKNAEGHRVESSLTVTEAGGQWKSFSRKRSDPCVGVEAPIAFTDSSADALKFTVRYSSVIPGCSDAQVSLQREADGRISGLRGDAPMKLTRKD